MAEVVEAAEQGTNPLAELSEAVEHCSSCCIHRLEAVVVPDVLRVPTAAVSVGRPRCRSRIADLWVAVQSNHHSRSSALLVVAVERRTKQIRLRE